jgi:DNA repair protein RadA/Sms
MPRQQTEYVCRQCGSQYPQSYGKCPGCGSWDSLEAVVLSSSPGRKPGATPIRFGHRAQSLASVRSTHEDRIRVPIEEFNRVLGGGIVPASVVLLGGDPGIGKSTILLQISLLAAMEGSSVLYVSGEESPEQIKLRADRLGPVPDGVAILAETDVDIIVDAARASGAGILIVDSIQTMSTSDIESAAGSVSQTRECTSRLVRLAKGTNMAIFLVGHVTKEGNIAGPKVLEHMVDVVLYLEGDRFQAYRLLRGIKNRYGPTHEIGVFDMHEAGLVEVLNPSALFLSDDHDDASRSAIAITVEGTRPLLVEIQALATPTSFGLPRRSSTGVDVNRLHMLTAVLAKRAHVDVSGQDIYVNAVGGLRLLEPAIDLATICAIYSSYRDIPMPRVAVVGEVGLGGEVRSVQHIRRRLQEAHKLGIRHALVPARDAPEVTSIDGMRVDAVRTVADALETLKGPFGP